MLYKNFEWEILEKDYTFTNSYKFDLDKEIPNITEINIKRNDYYNIEITLKGYISKEFFQAQNNLRKENFFKKIKIFDKSEEWELNNLYVIKTKITSKNYIITLSCNDITYNYKENKLIEKIEEWYINGPNNLLFNNVTEYETKKYFKRTRRNSHYNYSDNRNIRTECKITTTQDYFYCNLKNNKNIVIHKTPSFFGPKWSTNIGIQYEDKEYINNNSMRENIKNIISFAFGKNLIKIAESYYDSDGNKIKEVMINPNIQSNIDLRKICKSRELIPFYFDRLSFEFESVLTNLINEYIDKINEIDFTTMFNYYWNSFHLSPESKIILLASCLESLFHEYFKQYSVNNTIIPKKEYKNRVKSIKESFYKEFENETQLKNNFNQINRKSINANFLSFFDEIGIKVGELEKAAIKYRNKPVHGNDLNKCFDEVIIYSIIYHSLVNRCILKLLHFNGQYNISTLINPIDLSDEIPYSINELKNIFEIKSF